MTRRVRLLFVLFILAMLALSARAPADADFVYWRGLINPVEHGAGMIEFGEKSIASDGWDGQAPVTPPPPWPGVVILLYRQNGPDWSGPTGFYMQDYMAPIAPGGSKTWRDIYLWGHNYSPPANRADIVFGSYAGDPAPPGYTASLVLDYVPAHMNWTGPMQFGLTLWPGRIINLPVPTASDPFDPSQVTRMHLTVHAIPEPCSLAFLGLGAIMFGTAAGRRKRR